MAQETLVNEEISKMAKRINERYNDIVRTYGTDNEQAQLMLKYISDISTYNPKASYKISKVPKLNSKDILILNKLNKMDTRGKYTKRKREEYKRIFGKKPTLKELKEYIKQSSEMHDFIQQHADVIYALSTELENALHRADSLTADEWQKLIELKTDYERESEQITPKLLDKWDNME